ncbi:Phytanoyl-CoA dioxygenase (PhyH) [Seminavis robusta]|uniref:Phytanoyl-CoA dioxygenase (PhyH) n=1 Tax=Seminavis robusta TaxID=568900 RepID=A0A9N8H669_9STRA|nr:Phytanoyl-CoA dioxygenase (PhyH) [Seminavis robusta]|eukprot:Sro91_g047850.1 Phytanoyl-CoA dioxygenase (PhyH) (397) ;mRNA; r:102861-104051
MAQQQKTEETESIVSAVGSFNRKDLKPSVTTITADDGSVFFEELSSDGTFQARKVGQKKDMSYLHRTKKSVTIDTSPVPRFRADDPYMAAFLQEHGYVVVKGVLESKEVAVAHDKLWEFLESTFEWKRHDPETWTSFYQMGMPHNGIIHDGGVGQCDLQWYIRCLPKVQQAFRTVWGQQTKGDKESLELLTSFDGINVFRPWQYKPGWKTRDGWSHVDQGFKLQGFHCVQGLVTLTDATTMTGGFVAVPKSHKFHSAFINYHATTNRNFVRIPLNSPGLPTEMHHQLRFVSAQAGDLILWDSRTIHANIPALEKPSMAPSTELLRAVSYVCMTPKHLATPAVLQERRGAFEEGETTGHWPHLSPGRYGEDAGKPDTPPPETPKLNKAPEAIRRLVG